MVQVKFFMLKNSQTYFKNLVVVTTSQRSQCGHFSALSMKGLTGAQTISSQHFQNIRPVTIYFPFKSQPKPFMFQTWTDAFLFSLLYVSLLGDGVFFTVLSNIFFEYILWCIYEMKFIYPTV